VGCIALTVAADAGRVVGVESFASAVRLARENAQLNGIENCLFLESDAAEALKPAFLAQFGRPDVVILDPPRAGLHPDVVKRLLKLHPPILVYSSCNPATQARDLKLLSSGYRVDLVQPVDMFPQTYHIEAVARLTARPKGQDSSP
jgi:23S rRNA (uracil1939-C5)-methyltransferase